MKSNNEKLKECKAVLKLIRSNYRAHGRDSSGRMICRLDKEDVELIEKCLTNE